LRTAGLDHEVGNHAVELQAVVKALVGQLLEVLDGARRLVGVQFETDVAPVGFDRGYFHDEFLACRQSFSDGQWMP